MLWKHGGRGEHFILGIESQFSWRYIPILKSREEEVSSKTGTLGVIRPHF